MLSSAECKLIFVVDIIRACVALHEEGVRAAAVAATKPVAPYTTPYDLSASTRWGVGAATRVERVQDVNTAKLMPLRAASAPSDGERPRSEHIYSRGVDAASLRSTSTTATQVRRQPLPKINRGARALNRPHRTQHNPLTQFLSDAVALGSGTGVSLAARRAQILYDQTIAAPALSSVVSNVLAESAGWKERAAADAARVSSGAPVEELVGPLASNPPPGGALARVLTARAQGVQAALTRLRDTAHPPGMHENTGAGPIRAWPGAGDAAGTNSVTGALHAEPELGSVSRWLNVVASSRAGAPEQAAGGEDPSRSQSAAQQSSQRTEAGEPNSASTFDIRRSVLEKTASILSASLAEQIDATTAQVATSLSNLESQLISLEERERFLSARASARVESLAASAHASADALNAHASKIAPPLGSSLAAGLRATLAARPSTASHHAYALLPSSQTTKLIASAANLAMGPSTSEDAARSALASRRDLARNTLVSDGADAAAALLAAASLDDAINASAAAPAAAADDDDDDAHFGAALLRERVRENVVAEPAAAVEDARAPTDEYLSALVSKFAALDAQLARNGAFLGIR